MLTSALIFVFHQSLPSRRVGFLFDPQRSLILLALTPDCNCHKKGNLTFYEKCGWHFVIFCWLDFEVSQKQNNGRSKDKLRWKFAKRLTLELIEAFFI